ncbi:DNA cytosine methyltransferase [Deinococcus sp. YIM 134068]|uniref:DNA cytosine methyltransferase n=1 Tax=Deinococcus lichenicola TaxID=3118910 RepID=UPI002F938DD3
MQSSPGPASQTIPTLEACGIAPDASLQGLQVGPEHHSLIFSFFSGSGFLDLGFEREGFLPVLVNEYHAPFLAAYQHSRQRMHPPTPAPKLGYLQGSIEVFQAPRARAWLKRQIAAARSLGKPVGFIGGPPCPDFSNAGKHRGKDGDHGRLTQVYVDLIITHRPDFFVFENVKGLMRNHAEHLQEIEEQLAAAGYRFATRLANALEYGVAQDRERVVIVGFHKSLYQRAGLRVPRLRRLDASLWQAEIGQKAAEIKKLPWPTTEPFLEGSSRSCPAGLPANLTVDHWFRQNEVEQHPNARQRFQPRQGLTRMQQVPEGDVSRKSFKRLHRWRYAATAAYGNNEVHLHPSESRRLSVAEALAIQSMPGDFELPADMSLSNMFKTVGNGVPFLMSRGIACTVKRQLVALAPQQAQDTPAPGEDLAFSPQAGQVDAPQWVPT